jgi:hypothetical protein
LTAPNFLRLAATRLALSEAKTRSGIDDKSHSGEYCIAVALSQLGIGVAAIIEPDMVTPVCVAERGFAGVMLPPSTKRGCWLLLSMSSPDSTKSRINPNLKDRWESSVATFPKAEIAETQVGVRLPAALAA